MSSVRPSLLLLFCTVVATIVGRGAAAYCDDNLFPEDDEHRQPSGGVRLTKELSATEYGPLNSFKTLHCCGKSYLSLEWFKDNRPYPWPSDVSSFILNPESANQTIYTQSLKLSDHGVYTCQLANQTNIVNHSIKLVTIDVQSYWGDPLATYRMPDYHYAMLEDSVRLYCEGFVGKIDLPDAVNTIKWRKIGGNETIEPNDKYRTEQVIREDSQVLGAFLFINNIQETDYGQYMCSISNTDDQILQQYTNITKPVFIIEQLNKKVHKDLKLIIFVMLALILIVWKRRLFYSAYFALRKKFENDKYTLSEKTVYNVVVFHDAENKESAQYLVEKMEHYNNYVTKKHQIDFDEDFIKTHADLIKGFDFAIYLLSSDRDSITSSLMTKPVQKSFVQDNASPKKYIIDCGNMPVTPTKSWCDKLLADLSSEQTKQNQNTPNKLMRIV